MDGHIGHLHCDYRILGNSASANVLVARLERMAREQIAVNYATALDEALGDDPAVYILRQVDFDIALLVDVYVTDAQLAQRWGDRMAGAVMHAIAAQSTGTVSPGGRDAGAPLLVVCFANQAEYVARFLADLAHGTPWNQWFYGAFAALRARDPWEIVRTVLHENADHLPAILGYLQRYGALAALLAMLDASTQRWLWSQVRIAPGTERAAFGSLLVEALRLVDQLDLWAASPSNREVLLQAYLATRPSPPDWRDRIGLAAALLHILRFLTTHGHLRPPWAVPSEAEGGESIFLLGSQAHRDQERYQTFLERLREVLASLDWLDRAWLQVAFAEMLVESYPLSPGHAQDDWAVLQNQISLSGSLELLGRQALYPHEDELHAVLPLRPAGHGPTPRQRELLESLLVVLRAGGLGLDHRQPDAPANALRLYAVFVEQFPGWAGDPMAPEMIQRLLMAWAWVMRARSATEMLRWLHSRDSAAVLRALPEGARAGAATAFQFLADLGPLALTVIETLATSDNGAALFSRAGIDTQCAGVALLFRALLDSRLAGLVEREHYPAQGTLGASHLQSMLLALYMRWAGPYGVVDGQIDRGLLLFAGQDNDDVHREADWSLATLRARWSTTSLAEEARFQATWLQTMVSQRLLGGIRAPPVPRAAGEWRNGDRGWRRNGYALAPRPYC